MSSGKAVPAIQFYQTDETTTLEDLNTWVASFAPEPSQPYFAEENNNNPSTGAMGTWDGMAYYAAIPVNGVVLVTGYGAMPQSIEADFFAKWYAVESTDS